MKLLLKALLILLNLGILASFAVVLLLRLPVEASDAPPSPFAPRAKMDRLPLLHFEVFDTGHSDALEALVVHVGSLFRRKRLTHSVVLIRHPKGTLILDSGLGSHFSSEVDEIPWLERAIVKRGFIPGTPLKDRTINPPLDPARDFFLVSHAHWDHLGGMLDVSLPIRLLKSELDFALSRLGSFSHGVLPFQIDRIKSRLAPIQLEAKPYENFTQSLDLFGDGSLVLVSLSGHTPGSLGLFANLASGKRFLFVGDALWSVDSRGRPEAKSWVAERFSDFDPLEARKVRKRLAELIRHSNEVILVPSHDTKALALVTQTD